MNQSVLNQPRQAEDNTNGNRLAQYRAKESLFAQMAPVAYVETGTDSKGIGFKDGKLVLFDGSDFVPVTLAESARWLATATEAVELVQANPLQHGEAEAQWLKLIADQLQRA